MCEALKITQGDTVNFPVGLPAGFLAAGTWVITSSIRTEQQPFSPLPGVVVGAFTPLPNAITVTDITLPVTFVLGMTAAQSAAIPVGFYDSDVLFGASTGQFHSPKFNVKVCESAT